MTPWLAADGTFAPLLALLPAELARSLGPWLDKLASAIGPLRARARTGSGAPDGFDGLTLRGPYERLVLSEWAIVDVAPEEFLRRAAQHEHPFYQLARREEAKARTSVALFDPGPLQLGGPRVGQFAVLLVLAARASAAGARFGWSMLQRAPDPGDATAGLRAGVTEEGIRSFLWGRLATPPAERDLAPWFERARRDDWEDLWVVGPPDTVAPGRRLPGVKTPVGRVTLAEVFEPGARALDVTVARGAHRRALRLPLPPEADCLRMLRDGAVTPKPPPPVRPTRVHGVAKPASRALLLADGRKVAYVDTGGSVTVYTVPDAPSPKRPRFKRYTVDAGHIVLGLGWARRQLVLVTEKGSELHVHDTSGLVFPYTEARRPSRSGEWHAALRPAQLASVEFVASPDGALTALFVDSAARLVALVEGPPHAVVWSGGVRSLATLNQSVHVAVARDATGARHTPGLSVSLVDGTEVRLCTASSVKLAPLQRQPGGEWHVPQFGTIHVVRPSRGAEVLGVASLKGLALGLLAIDADRRTVRAVGPDGDSVLFVVVTPVRHAVATPRGDRVAFVHDDGSVSVWSPPTAQELLHLETPL